MFTLNKPAERKPEKNKNKVDSFVDDAIDKVKDAEAKDALVGARTGLLLKEPFFGNLSIRFDLINADSWLETISTDGKNFYYNTDFVLSQKREQLKFAFGHVILHCVYDHMGRVGSRDWALSQIAADYAVNQDLVDNNIGQRVTSIPILYDSKYSGWSFEQIYDDLYKKSDKIDLDELMASLLDDHPDDDGPPGSSSGTKVKSEGNRPGPLTPEEKEKIREDFLRAMIAAAEAAQASKDAGNIPGNILEMIREMTEPKMDWRQLLDVQIKSLMKTDYSFARPHRKLQYLTGQVGTVFPGMISEDTIDIVVAVDTSGSVDDEMLRDFLGEVKGIMDAYTTFRLKLFCFDTEVHSVKDFTEDNMQDFLTGYEIGGRGGTSFACVL